MTILFLALAAIHLVGIIVLLSACRTAPKGHEDVDGFHLDA